jgi:drug/metabolite transporter (DMT)-like permease
MLLGSLVLGEQVSAVQLVGMFFITSGLIVIDGRVLTFAGRMASRQRWCAKIASSPDEPD